MRKIDLATIISKKVKPILEDENLGLQFYSYLHLPKRYVELDAVYTDKLVKQARARESLQIEYDHTKKLLDEAKQQGEKPEIYLDEKALTKKVEELELKLKKADKEARDGLYYQLAPLCQKSYEELKDIILVLAGGDEEIAAKVVLEELYKEYLLALKEYAEDEKKTQEQTGLKEVMGTINPSQDTQVTITS